MLLHKINIYSRMERAEGTGNWPWTGLPRLAMFLYSSVLSTGKHLFLSHPLQPLHLWILASFHPLCAAVPGVQESPTPDWFGEKICSFLTSMLLRFPIEVQPGRRAKFSVYITRSLICLLSLPTLSIFPLLSSWYTQESPSGPWGKSPNVSRTAGRWHYVPL